MHHRRLPSVTGHGLVLLFQNVCHFGGLASNRSNRLVHLRVQLRLPWDLNLLSRKLDRILRIHWPEPVRRYGSQCSVPRITVHALAVVRAGKLLTRVSRRLSCAECWRHRVAAGRAVCVPFLFRKQNWGAGSFDIAKVDVQNVFGKFLDQGMSAAHVLPLPSPAEAR